MLAFETITFAPFDYKLIDLNLMNADEVAWVNNYHAKVNEKLCGELDSQDVSWLKQATKAIA